MSEEQTQGPSVTRPPIVTKALVLLYIALGIGPIRIVMEVPGVSTAVAIIPALILTALLAGFVYLIGTGRNWARITLLVLVLIGIPFSVAPLLEIFRTNFVSGVLGLVQAVLQIVALVFLFQKQSSEWFKARSRKSSLEPQI